MQKDIFIVIPTNDPEAVMLYQVAKAFEFPVWESKQPHGATLDKEPDFLEKMKLIAQQKILIVEMPGLETEQALRAMGKEVIIIDHHRYTNLDRAIAPDGSLLPSSLQQFLEVLNITDEDLKNKGFDPILVRGIGYMDQGYVWYLREKNYNEEQIKKIIEYQRELMSTVRGEYERKNDIRKDFIAKKAWDNRKQWGEFFIIETEENAEIRSRISLIVALEIKKPTPLIIIEKGRGFIYVQESDYALQLFAKFGGFTFGMDRNWGIKTADINITTDSVCEFIESLIQSYLIQGKNILN